MHKNWLSDFFSLLLELCWHSRFGSVPEQAFNIEIKLEEGKKKRKKKSRESGKVSALRRRELAFEDYVCTIFPFSSIGFLVVYKGFL